MITSFLEAWPLFQHAFVAGWEIAFVLSLLGIIVVSRDQVFVGVAMSQASMLGIALWMWSGCALAGTPLAILGTEPMSAAWAIAFSIGCAMASARAEARGGETHEAITGWVFLAAGSTSILILAKSPHAVEEMHRLVASSLIGAGHADVLAFAALGTVTAFSTFARRREIMLYSMDPAMASAVGLPVGFMSVAVAIVIGVAVGLSIRASGMLYTFGCLVLPAMAAKSLCGEVRQMFVVAPVVAVCASVVGFVVAHHEDYPPAQMTVALLSVVVVVAWIVRRLRTAFGGPRTVTPPAG
jgi:ABC-type Mn2+/Zn2+ transport system permease subunit